MRVPCTAAHAHVCMHTLRVACLPVLYVGSSRVTTGWRVILSASGWADLTSRVWRTQLRCDPEPRLWPGGFGTFRKRTDMSGDALGTRSLSTPLPMVAEPAQNRATDPYFVLPSSDKRMKGRAISNWSPRSEPAQANGRPLGCALIGPVASNGNLSSSIKRNPRRPSSVSRHA